MHDRTNATVSMEQGESSGTTRRQVLAAGLALALGGCASTRPNIPVPAWGGAAGRDDRRVDPRRPVTSGLMARDRWAEGPPVPALMNTMAPITYITIHHDGMTPFTRDDAEAARSRLERIRLGHRGRGWGDIGYHYAVDRAGTVWACRPIQYQGAHVKHHNAGNVGILALGNLDVHPPTDAQVDGVRRQVAAIAQTYRVPESRVRTHREWAPTICPGQYMQSRINEVRMHGAFA
ncbi:MAG: peptidoglycan recognition family protein [Planctomycetota bacterium]